MTRAAKKKAGAAGTAGGSEKKPQSKRPDRNTDAALVQFSLFKNARATEPRSRKMSWREFTTRLSEPVVHDVKTDSQALAPCLFKRGTKRAAANVEAMTLAALDLDNGKLTRQDIVHKLDGYAHAIYSTWSSEPHAPRYRVLIPLAQPVSPLKAASIQAYFDKVLGGDVADPACKDAARLSFLPSVRSGREREFEFEAHSGKFFEATKLPDSSPSTTSSKPIKPAVKIPPRFNKLLKTDDDLRRRWEGDDSGLTDKTGSGMDMSIAKLLANREFSPEEIAAVLLEFEHGSKQKRSAHYIARTVRKACAQPEAQKPKQKPKTALGELRYQRLLDVHAEPVMWIWEYRLARSKVTILAGDTGIGKSQATLSLATPITAGGKWPDGTLYEGPRGNVIILSAEDEARDVIKARFVAAGGDPSRVYVIDAVHIKAAGKAPAVERLFSLAEDIERLAQMIKKIGDVALVIIDPITAYLGKVDSHKASEVRSILHPLSKHIADECRVAVICVTHLTKAGPSEAKTRIMGSQAFLAAARGGYLHIEDAECESRYLFLPIKQQFGPSNAGGFAYTIEGCTVEVDGQQIETSRVVWHGRVKITADQAMGALKEKQNKERRPQQNNAGDWLLKMLGDGPKPAKELRAAAERINISWSTLKNAKRELGVIRVRKEKKALGGWIWEIKPAPKY